MPPQPPTIGPVLVGSEPLVDIQRAVYEVLDAVPALHGIVFDYVPENVQPPYVTWSTGWLAERNNLNAAPDRVWFQVDCWSRYRGYAEAGRLAQHVTAALDHLIINMPGYLPVHMIREQVHATRDPDNTIRRFALTFFCPYVAVAPTP
jgi:hypothetical protein